MIPSYDPPEYSFPRYLAAKKSVDDRALNKDVWQRLEAALATRAASEPLQVLEVGAGIGTMIERLLDWGLLSQAEITAIDARAENIAAAGQRLPEWAATNGWAHSGLSRSLPDGVRLELSRGAQRIRLDLEAVDLFDFILQQAGRQWDLLIAHAFLDLVDSRVALPQLLHLLRPGGLGYFTINFDGVTGLEPVLDPDLDGQIERLYHQTMDQRRINGQLSGDSRTGRHLFAHLKAAGAEILAAGASDWVVFAGPGGYPADEAYFLHFIIGTIAQALNDHPTLEPGRFTAWISGRHAQVERGELVYLAHQLDFLCQRPGQDI